MTVEALVARPLDEVRTPKYELSAGLRHVGAVCILTLCGDLAASSVSILESQFDRLGRTSCRRVVLDVSQLTGIDETGTRVITGLRHYVRARGGVFSIVGAAGTVAAALT
ncbi:MAG: STAS domain-containing protein [Acidimicrobiales bacterium]